MTSHNPRNATAGTGFAPPAGIPVSQVGNEEMEPLLNVRHGIVFLALVALALGCTQAVRSPATVASVTDDESWSDWDGDIDSDWEVGAPGTVVVNLPQDLLEPEAPRRQTAAFQWPTVEPEITSRFLARRGRQRWHKGIDLRAQRGEPLLASATGRVSFSGYQGGYGKVVIITHAEGFESRYAHASELLVRQGQVVRRGQLIARAGRTGNARGPHCHFELRRNGRPIDPVPYMQPVQQRLAANADQLSH